MRSARRRKTHSPTRSAFESLEPRAMLAGLGPDALSSHGSTAAVPLLGSSSPSGLTLTSDSTTPGSTSGAVGSPSSSPVPLGGTGTATGTAPAWTSSGAAPSGPVVLGGVGSGTGSTASGTASNTDPQGPVLLSQYSNGSDSSNNSDGTLIGSDLWFFYGAGLSASAPSFEPSDDSLSNLLTLLSQYAGGSNSDGQSNYAVSPLTDADLWSLYGAVATAGASSGSTNDSLANDPIISTQYTGGSRGGQEAILAIYGAGGLAFFFTGASESDATVPGNQPETGGSSPLSPSDVGTIGRITPLIYAPLADGPPVYSYGIWNGDEGGPQFVNASDGEGGPPPGQDGATASVSWYDWYRSFWRTEAKPVTPQSNQPRSADIPALGLPDQLPATRPDGSIDPNFNNTVEKATPTGIGARAVGEAPWIVKPGVRVLEGIHVDDLKRQHPWRAHYDEFGRLIGRTDWDPRNLPGIPPVHYHTYKWTRGGVIETGKHIPGEYVP